MRAPRRRRMRAAAPGRSRRATGVLAAAATVLAALAAVVALPLAASGGPGPGGPTGHAPSGSAPGTAAGAPTGARTAGGQAATQDRGSHGHLPPAPKGFAGQLDGIYGQIYSAITTFGVPTAAHGSASVVPSTAAFNKMVSRLSPKDLSVLAAGTAKSAGWPSLRPILDELDLDAVAHPGAAASAFSSSASASASASGASPAPSAPSAPAASGASAGSPTGAQARTVTAGADASAPSTFPPTSPTGPFPQPPQPYSPTSPVGPANLVPANCPPPAPGPDFGAAASYSAQLSLDIITETVTALPSQVGVIIAGVPAVFPDPARIALQVVADADSVLLQTMNYMNAVNNDCGAVQADQLSSNIDNTTLNTYALMTLMESTLNDIENSVNTVSGQVHVVQQTMDAQLRLTIEQDLAEPVATTPDLALELPASVGGNLDSTPIGVKAIVSAAVQAIGAAGEAENPAAGQYLAMGNAALAAGHDKQAYADYHTAYLEAVQ